MYRDTVDAETRAAFASVIISTYAGSDFNDLCISGRLRTNQIAAVIDAILVQSAIRPGSHINAPQDRAEAEAPTTHPPIQTWPDISGLPKQDAQLAMAVIRQNLRGTAPQPANSGNRITEPPKPLCLMFYPL